jgi:hypothetical protein
MKSSGVMAAVIWLSIFLAIASISACGQDAGAMAAQQASQAAMNAGLQAAQQMQQDMMAAGQAAALAMQMNQRMNQQFNQQMLLNNANGCEIGPAKFYGTWLPQFSKKSGLVKAGTAVRIKWRASDFAWVYYSTDGSTPTTASAIYKGPIIIDAPTHLRAIAAAPGLAPSKVFDAYYDVTPSTAQTQPVHARIAGPARPGQ